MNLGDLPLKQHSHKALDKVSIVVPVYNRAALVLKSLESLLAQTHRPIEIIVVDDGSSDGTGDVARQWQRENESLDFVVKVLSQDNSGAPVARNRGLHAASSDFIAFLDSDDSYHPQFIELLLHGIASNADVDLSACAMENVDYFPERPHFFERNAVNWSRTPLAFGKEYWATPNVLYKRDRLVKAGGWNPDLRYGWQDRELCLRLQLLGFRYVRCDLPLFWCRTNSAGRISDIAHSKDARFFVGIAAAARSLSVIALKRVRISEAIWLLSRCGKWYVTAIYRRYRQLHLSVSVRPGPP